MLLLSQGNPHAVSYKIMYVYWYNCFMPPLSQRNPQQVIKLCMCTGIIVLCPHSVGETLSK